MAELFSITASAIGIADVCVRAGRYLKDVYAASGRVEQDIDDLIKEIDTVKVVTDSIEGAFTTEFSKPTSRDGAALTKREELWKNVNKSLQDCEAIVKRLEHLAKSIHGQSGPKVTGRLDSLSKWSRQRDKAPVLLATRHQLKVCQKGLELLLATIGLDNQQKSQDTIDVVFTRLVSIEQGLKSQITALENKLQSSLDNHTSQQEHDHTSQQEQDTAMLSTLKQLDNVTSAVAAALPRGTLNKHFDPPQSLCSYYTGRDSYLVRLREILRPQGPATYQQRFVIQGMGGAGKTQFSCKFAEQNRDRFWGIFYLDASSEQRITQTYAALSKYGKFEPNKGAAMHWLSNLSEPWLLIVDNADMVNLDQCFPKGDRGCVLVTTRNPGHRVYGNVSPGYFEFHGMENGEANTLLLRAAQQPQPWDAEASSCASRITRQLGYLALALEHAGAAIRNRLCTLKNYLSFYDRSWERIRRSHSPAAQHRRIRDDYKTAYTSYEVAFEGLVYKDTEASADAVQLLKMFSFFYFKNICLDTLKRAIANAEIEAKQNADNGATERPPSRTWLDTFNLAKLAVTTFFTTSRGPPALPSVIREGRETGFLDEDRIREALAELVQLSLITDNNNDVYSMHPLIHKWVRERPEMITSEQAVWSHAAAATLAHSMLLPPVGSSEANQAYLRSTISHVDHVRARQDEISKQIAKNRAVRWHGLLQWPNTGLDFSREKALMYAKFSIVYFQGGRYEEAEQLQLQVQRFTVGRLGLRFPVSRRISLALTGTYLHQGRFDEAANLQTRVLQACVDTLGADAHETLRSRVILGQTMFQQGQYSDARKLLVPAVNGLQELLGLQNEDTLDAMGHLGKVLTYLYDFEEAERLQQQTIAGFTRLLGPNHERTLIAQEDGACIAVFSGNGVTEALQTMVNVFRRRKETLGKEHPYTLLAMANLGRLKSMHNEYTEAESLVRAGLAIADRNLGENHVGASMGRTILGEIFDRQGKYEDAETILLDVTERQRSISSLLGSFHPDRIWAMSELSRCYQLQGKFSDSLRICDECLESLQRITKSKHPLEEKLSLRRKELLDSIP
ncbi:MAG: hypothetical protein M1828_006800 [Chrysothrix sp. TS-e1954]|nr:MAG: hypothetical protein M1828_006800 [Chrysothrix sp. TS-e1954]